MLSIAGEIGCALDIFIDKFAQPKSTQLLNSGKRRTIDKYFKKN